MSSPLYFFSDYACPWCYLGYSRLQKVVGEHPVTVVHFPLSPDTPAEGRDIVAHLKERGIDIGEAVRRLSTLLEAEGMPYNTRMEGRMGYNTEKAQELALWADSQGVSLHERLFHAYHVDCINLYDDEVLCSIADEAGLDAQAARDMLATRSLRDQRQSHWSSARAAGVTGVPTFVKSGQGVVGAQPTATLQRLLALD